MTEADRQKNIEHFQELFGCSEAEAVSMLETFNYNLQEASLAMSSMREPTVHPVQETSPGVQQHTSNVIDLTSNQDDDLKRALRLSLQDQKTNGISYEDEQLSKAVEESLAESKQAAHLMGFTSTSYFTDPLNPHEKRRQEQLPVGIKNLGNTCWFNVAIQSLFHIPAFRKLIIEFHPPPPAECDSNSQHQHCVMFVKELQKLFSLLLQAQTKYIEPTDILKLLQTSGTQQDIAEFIHKFLEWLEDAFTVEGEDSENPVKKLFFGQCQTIGVSEGSNFVNESKLGAFPLEVRGCATLYDSLSAATYSKKEPGRRQSLSQDSIHESWFTHLPPVMILELSRFEYSTDSKQVLKINDSLDFEKVLYMDRFLLENKDATLASYDKEVSIKSQLQGDRDNYHRLSNYCGKPVSLLEVLSLVRTYASDRVSAGENSEEDIAPLGSLLDRWKAEVEHSTDDVLRKIDSSKQSLSALYSDPTMRATPYQLHAVCVHQGDASVGHYWVYVNPKTSGLPSVCKVPGSKSSDDVEDMEVTPVAVQDPSSQKFVFSTSTDGVTTSSDTEPTPAVPSVPHDDTALTVDSSTPGIQAAPHSSDEVGQVLAVEEDEPRTESGLQLTCAEANQEDSDEMWYKFNDVNVTTVPWSEVLKESCGQGVNTSAYCFVYLSSEVSVHQAQETRLCLSEELLAYVQQYNETFEEDVRKWDSKSKQDPTTPVKSSLPATDWTEPASAGGPTSAIEMVEISGRTLSAQLDMLIEEKSRQLCNTGVSPQLDDRYMSAAVFYLKSGAPEYYCQYFILDFVVKDLQSSSNTALLEEAEKRKSLLSGYNQETLLQDEKQWQVLYQRYQQLCLHVISADEACQKGMYDEAVNQALAAYAINCELARSKEDVGLKTDFVVTIVALATNRFNSHVLQRFLEESYDVMDICIKLLVPCVHVLSQCGLASAQSTLESVRRDWCAQVEKEGLPEDILDKFADLIPALMEDYDSPLPWHAELSVELIECAPVIICRRLHEIVSRTMPGSQ